MPIPNLFRTHTGRTFAAYEKFGVEDPRVTEVQDEYLIIYSAYSRNGVRVL